MSLLDVATEVRLDATRHLAALAGDATMCAIGRSGRSFPAAKYHEGRQAASGQVRRLLRSVPAGTTPAESAVLADVTSQWRERLADSSAMGPDWVAYATGGLDALAELAEHARA